ncbi:hypothetical protein Tco_0657170 [Tanacetum coccineum]|uniref:Uncharacterized protein n=1 Tax=Tanacetum coccineum TaxID=301880 RepID=A0ABQ4XC54_9ASTR
MEEIFDQMNNEVDKNTVDKQCAEIEKKNLLIENENLIVNCLSTQLLYDVEKSRCLDLEADMSKIKNLEHQIQEKDNVIRHLKDLVANVNDRSREPHNAIDVTALIEQNDCDRVELEKCGSLLRSLSIVGFRNICRHVRVPRFSMDVSFAHDVRIESLRSSFVRYYRRFIVNSSKVAKPLASLTQKIRKYESGPKRNKRRLFRR